MKRGLRCFSCCTRSVRVASRLLEATTVAAALALADTKAGECGGSQLADQLQELGEAPMHDLRGAYG